MLGLPVAGGALPALGTSVPAGCEADSGSVVLPKLCGALGAEFGTAAVMGGAAPVGAPGSSPVGGLAVEIGVPMAGDGALVSGAAGG